MYQDHFGLAEAPFSIAPDPRYLYMSQRHQEALAHLLYGVNGDGGFVLLTGEVGAGKTTVCRCLLEQIPAFCDIAYIFNPKLSVEELLSTICTEFRIGYPAGNTSIKVFVDSINAYLLDAHARGRHTVLVIDEAQNLATDVLEQMRLLTNLETNERKLLQIILLGQPELATMLARPELKQLAQRIVARYHLGPLTKAEVAAYVRHRLEVAGAKRPLFPSSLVGPLYRMSRGIPRVINVLCDRALLGAFVQGKEKIDRATLAQAAREVLDQPASRRNVLQLTYVGVFLLMAFAAIAIVMNEAARTNRAIIELAGKAQPTPAATVAPGAEKKSAPLPQSLQPLPAVLIWPATEPIARSKALADAALFRAWGADYQGGDACTQAKSLGLRCRSARGGLDELRLWNRPAVLRMRDDQGRDFQATLTALQNSAASFVIGADTNTVALNALASHWSGDYTLLWRSPPEGLGTIRPGDRGAAAAWLSKQLAQLRGAPVESAAGDVYDDAMVRQVKEFQLARGLIPDGSVGPQTLMRLAAAADANAPKLVRDKEDKVNSK